jgi:hypothetical protein
MNDDQPAEPLLSNMDRLLQHLQADSLATQLVEAHQAAANPTDGLKKALAERLEQVRRDLDGD